MKILILLLLLSINLWAQESKQRTDTLMSEQKCSLETLQEIRKVYYASVEEEDSLESLNSLIVENFSDSVETYPPVILSYVGGIEALKSKHAFWPIEKLSKLNDSMDILQKAIDLEPENLEIRFMRFSILHYVPGFLGWGNEKEEDIKVIVELLQKDNLKFIDPDLRKGITEFMIASERLSPKEIKLLNNEVLLSVDN